MDQTSSRIFNAASSIKNLIIFGADISNAFAEAPPPKQGFYIHPNKAFLDCCKPPRYVPYKGTYVPYEGTHGAPDQGQTLDVQEGQTNESALRDDWTWNVPHHTLEVVLEITLEVLLEYMCAG